MSMPDFAAQIDSVLAEGRAMAEALMTDTCIITRAGVGKGTLNPETGQRDDAPAHTTIYTGICRVQVTSIIANSASSTAGERQVIIQGSELHLPVVGTEQVAINDVVEMLTAANDSALVGRRFTISARHEKSRATARRLRVQEVTG